MSSTKPEGGPRTFTHTLDWNGPDSLHPGWWVTTQKNGEPYSGMPLDYWLDRNGDGYRG